MKKILITITILLIVVFCVIATNKKSEYIKEDTLMNKSITMEEAKEIFKEKGNYIIVDVRRPDEYNEGHIPNAINIANETIDKEPKELKDKGQSIYVYCRTGRRSKEASEKLVNLGYANVIEIGGIVDWNGDIEK